MALDETERTRTRRSLIALNCVSNNVFADETHLAACIHWLEKAQDVNNGGGVSAAYLMDAKHWDVDYPETTGYIIPTFLAYWRLTGNDIYRQRAVAMGDWEISIQSPEGGAGEPVGVYKLQPRVFNTGQVILGWMALFAETGDSKYLDAADKSARWITNSLDPHGKWCINTYKGPKAYKSRVTERGLES